MRKFNLAVVIPLSIMSCSAVASYSDSSWELGVSAGQFNLKDSTGSYSGPSVGFNFIRNFNDWFSFEGNYLSSFNMDNANYDIQASTFSLAPVFTYHINDTFSIYGKGGASSMRITSSERNGLDYSYNTIDWFYGFGLNASINNRINVRLGYETVTGDTGIGTLGVTADGFSVQGSHTKISVISLGATYRF
ncbi:OmpA domain protein transmembrane region-containing protein [Shewanella baltica OS223]|uniref:porin family protein n=1 Tax=Shewanella baltica TaxID=62322 RepID=UPI0001883DC4|nr:porin family protein [Shewanella baltica]ACK45153.1 OmpA domain protein transmembrane region-containing protein [Shewanella baltica OS223]EHQ16506.1 OmpA domain-containing protein [Shewanella baltica OS183]HCE50564.1 porin family protein [Shewanella baltica]